MLFAIELISSSRSLFVLKTESHVHHLIRFELFKLECVTASKF
jgi:hypothetical protein